MMHRLLIVVVALVIPVAPCAFGQTWDAVAQFNQTGVQTTSSTWQYGTETGVGTGYALFPNFANETSPGPYSVYYYDKTNVGPGLDYNNSGGDINLGGSPNLIWPDNVLLFGPGGANNPGAPEYAVLRWVAPAAGTYNLTGFFENVQAANVSLYVLLNSNAASPLYSSSYSGGSGLDRLTFSASSLSLHAGDTLDFITGLNGPLASTNNYNDAVGVSATITLASSASTPTQVFPHVAADTSWQTDFVILNTSDSPVAFTLKLHPDSGTTIPIAGVGSVSEISGTAPAHGTAFYTTDTTVDSDGWAELDSATALSGVAVFRETNDQTSVLLSAPGTTLTIPYDSTAPPNSPSTPYVNGVAIANADPVNAAQLTCQAYDSNGNAIGGSLTGPSVPPSGHIAFVLQQTAPFTSLPANTRGQIVCNSTAKASAVVLRALGAQVSTMPVLVGL